MPATTSTQSYPGNGGIHNYKIMHKTTFVDYDSLIDASESTTDATIKYKRLYLHTQYISGSKDNVYTTPNTTT
jgi:hypothetical protein